MTEQMPSPGDPSLVVPRSGTAAKKAAAPVRSARSRMLRSSAIMASGSIVSRLLGFVRNYLYGLVTVGAMTVSGVAYNSANVLPDSIWILIGGGVLNAILVPAIVRAIKQPDRGSDYVSRLMTLVVLLAGILTLVCMLAVPGLVLVSSGDLPPASYALAVEMGYFLMPQIVFSAIYVMCGQLLNAHDSFGPYEWASVMNNLVGCLGAGAFLLLWGSAPAASDWTVPKLVMLMLMNVGGSVAQVAFLWRFVRRLGLRLRPRWGFRGLGLGKLSRIGLWTLGMVALGQLNVFAVRWATNGASRSVEHYSRAHRPDLASLYPSVGSLGWAYMTFMIPQGIIAVTLVTTAFPSISRFARDGDHSGALLRYAETSRLLAVPMVLCTAVFSALAVPIMWVIGGGSSPTAALSNGPVLAGYMLGLVPFSATYLVKRVFYAYEDARTPLYMQIPTTIISVTAVGPILLLVDPRWAATAAATVSSVGNFLGWALGLWLLAQRAHSLGARAATARQTVLTFVKLAVAGLAAFAVGFALWHLLEDAFFSHRLVAVGLGAAVGLVMTAVFCALAWILRVQELREVTRVLGRRLRRRAS